MFNLYIHTFSLRFRLRHQPDFDALAFIDLAAEEGFQGVCLSANGPNYRDLGSMEPSRFAEIAAHLAKRGLRCDLDTSGTDPAHLQTLLGVAQAVGAQKLRTYTRYSGTPDKLVAWSIRDLQAVAPLAAQMGITIMLENHEKLTGTEIRRILTAVNSPFVGALYDYGNSMMVLEDPYDALAQMAPFVRSAHLKDHVVVYGEDDELTIVGVPIGQGNIPILDITQRLLSSGLRDIAYENVWAYAAPVQTQRLTPANQARVGQGVFAYAAPPFDPRHILLEPDSFSPEQLVALEWEAFQTSLRWLRQQFAALTPTTY